MTSRGPSLAMESSDDDVPTGAGAGYGFARPNLATSGESSAHGDDDAGKVSGTIFEMSLLLRHTSWLAHGRGLPTPSAGEETDDDGHRARTREPRQGQGVQQARQAIRLPRTGGARAQTFVSRTTTAPAKKENRGRDANAPALREGEWDSWDIAAPADGGGARPSSGTSHRGAPPRVASPSAKPPRRRRWKTKTGPPRSPS